MDAHPGVLFREGPAGRRAVLAGGPDVWEVVRALKSAREAQADLGSDELIALVCENTGLTRRAVNVAVGYYADHPDEIDALIHEVEDAERTAQTGVDRRRSLLGR